MFDLRYYIFLLVLFINSSLSHVLWDTTNSLQPVHGLYVKPSIDGATGDLYVAASEDNGSKSQWLTDQPINFLPASSQSQSQAAPVSFASSVTKTSSPNEETITSQRRAVVTHPAIRYAYVLPVPAAEGNFMPPYPYALPTGPTVEGSNIPHCSDNPVQPYPPFHYFYPPVMSGIVNALNSLKENDTNEGPQNLAPPYWPHSYGYPYPYQYVMVDPNSWLQNQNNLTTAISTTSSENP